MNNEAKEQQIQTKTKTHIALVGVIETNYQVK